MKLAAGIMTALTAGALSLCAAALPAAPALAATKAAAKTYTVGFIPGITTDAFYISMLRGARAEAARLHIHLLIQGAAQWNYTLQTPIVNDMVTRKVNLLVIAPNDAHAMIPPLTAAVKAHIPVITVDTTISATNLLTARITSDNTQGGKSAADALAKLIGYKGDVAVLNTVPGVSTTDARQAAFIQEMKKFPNISIVSTQYTNDQQSTAAADVEDILLSHPQLKGVFATNVINAAGAAEGLKAKGVQGKVKLIAYDAEPEEVVDLKNGSIQALVVQKPYLEGQIAVQDAYFYLHGQKGRIRKSIVLANVIATRQNVNSPNIRKWFY